MNEGQKIEGLEEAPRRGPGRPPLNRPTIRPELREETRPDSVREAEEYALQLTEALGDTMYESDELFVDPSIVPAGWSYQWKRLTIAGKEDPFYMVGLTRAGWRPVPSDRDAAHAAMMPMGYKGPIEKKGLALMELPTVLTERSNKANIRKAREALRESEAQLNETPPNTGPRDEFPAKDRGVKREYMAPVGASKRSDPDED